MPFAIMRCTKLNTVGNIAASLQHCYRERPTENADADRTPKNTHQRASSTDDALNRMRELWPEKRRKDAVLCVEYLMTASPEWWETATSEQREDFFRRSVRWLTEKYGADQIVTSTIHRDETTPHLSAFVIPLKDGKLSAKHFIGGRNKMSADQTSFAACVSDLGLVRGIEGSQATHQSVKRHYGLINRVAAPGTAYKTFFGNIKPEAWDEAQNALTAFRAREKAIKQRELKLDGFVSRLETAEEKVKEAERYTNYINQQHDNMLLKLHKAEAEKEALENDNRELRDELNRYRNLLNKKPNDLGFNP